MNKKVTLVLVAIFFSASVIFAFLMGYFAHDWLQSSRQNYFLVEEARLLIQNHAYTELPASPDLEYGMIRGMLGTLNDPYTIFIEPAQAELQGDDLRGEFGGIGVRLEQNQSGEIMLFPFPESPAFLAGLRENDRLLRVDALEISADTPLADVQAALRGPEGSTVEITYQRANTGKPSTKKIRRTIFPLPSVAWNLAENEPRLGVIQISRMASTTTDELIRAVEDLQSRGAEFFVLDLRNNPGGLIDAGINVARLFLSSGTIIEQQYKNQPVESFTVNEAGRFSDLPLAVIINQGTASSAELVAGVLKAHQRAKIYGRPSFGKDTLQLVFELSDNSSLHITAAKWWIPGLESPLGGNGIMPDRMIPMDSADAPDEIQTIIQEVFSQP
jgi:carboxyl-terminal processing protease